MTLLDDASGCCRVTTCGNAKVIILMLRHPPSGGMMGLYGVQRPPLSPALHWGLSPGRPKNCFCSSHGRPSHASQNLSLKQVFQFSPALLPLIGGQALSPGVGWRTNTRTFSISTPTSCSCLWYWGMKLPLLLYSKST